jgi:hypothetical protein
MFRKKTNNNKTKQMAPKKRPIPMARKMLLKIIIPKTSPDKIANPTRIKYMRVRLLNTRN